ncbi:MAG: EAL domain-containing protein [Stenotrophobium sp.]
MVNSPSSKDAGPAAAANTLLLIVSESENITKRIESHLRNAGYPVRTAWATSLEDLESVLAQGVPHLLLCADGMHTAPLKDVVELCARLCPDLPVLLLSARYSADSTLAALAAGARDQVSYEDARHLRHLEMVCLRELASHHNVRELTSLRSRLEDNESRQKKILSGSTDAVAHAQEGIISDVNPAFASLLGYQNPDELAGIPLMDLVSADFQGRVKDHLKLLNKGKTDGKPIEIGLLKKDGMPSRVSALFTRNRVDGENIIDLVVHADAGAESVSGRMVFLEALSATLKNLPVAQKAARAALFISIDDYAGFESRMGFHDSEEALVKLMDWLTARLSPQDQLFRFSTGEFAAIVARPNVADFEQFGETLCADCAKQIFATQAHEAQLSISAAIYPISGSEKAPQLLSEMAQTARKLSAQGGKQSLVLGPTAKSSAAEREEARRAAQVKKAIEENRLKLAFQAIASLEGDSRQHYDVLVRLTEENGHELQASEFIHAAEKFGLMRALDRWVVSNVLKVMAKRTGSDEPSSLFVKISEETLKDAENFLPWLTEALKERAPKPGELVLEFQELRLQNHIRKAKTLIRALRDLGADIAIDHFGASTNSIQLTDHIAANYLKFSPSFAEKFNDKDTFSKMTTLIEVAAQKGIKTIVSHVEDANVMARLWQMGVNYIQGYNVQEPEAIMLATEVAKRSLTTR